MIQTQNPLEYVLVPLGHRLPGVLGVPGQLQGDGATELGAVAHLAGTGSVGALDDTGGHALGTEQGRGLSLGGSLLQAGGSSQLALGLGGSHLLGHRLGHGLLHLGRGGSLLGLGSSILGLGGSGLLGRSGSLGGTSSWLLGGRGLLRGSSSLGRSGGLGGSRLGSGGFGRSRLSSSWLGSSSTGRGSGLLLRLLLGGLRRCKVKGMEQRLVRGFINQSLDPVICTRHTRE